MKKLILSLSIVLYLATPCFASWSVWTESLLIDKIKTTYNPGTKNTSISIKSAKNEYVMVQLGARSTGETMAGFTPSIQTTFASGGNTIPNANVEFYLVNYISTVSGSAVYESATAWPDICVPYKDRFYDETRSGTDSGWGQTVAADTTQPFLVEIYIPTTTVAGTYTGVIRLTSTPGNVDITINLTVWNFTLPSQWSLKTSWGTEYYSADVLGTNNGSDAVKREYHYRMYQLMLDHGINLYGAGNRNNVNPGTDPAVFNHANFTNASIGFKNFLDGTASQDYFQKPLPVPNFWSTRRDDGTTTWGLSETNLDNWGTFMESYPNTIFGDKFADEPANVAAVNAYVVSHNTRHAGVGENYPDRPYEYYTAGFSTEPQDTNFWDDTYGHMWVVASLYPLYRPDNRPDVQADLDLATDFAARKASYGDQVWHYFAGDNDADMRGAGYRCASSPSIDAYARNNAWPPLEAYTLGAMGQHYWMVTIGWSGNTADTVWTNTNLFNPNSHYAGDGIYLYPGYPSGSDHDIGGTHYIPLESLRMKLYRWGMQIYEYAKLLEAAGKISTATTEIAKMLTYNNLRQPSGTITIGAVTAWDTARETMGNALDTPSTPAKVEGVTVKGGQIK